MYPWINISKFCIQDIILESCVVQTIHKYCMFVARLLFCVSVTRKRLSKLSLLSVLNVIVLCIMNCRFFFLLYILRVSHYIMSRHRGITSLVCHLGGITTPHSEVPTIHHTQKFLLYTTLRSSYYTPHSEVPTSQQKNNFN